MIANPTGGFNRNQWLIWAVPLFLSLALIVVSFDYFLLFHILVEFFAIIIAVVLAVVAWQTFPFTRNNMLMYLGCGYFWVSLLDMIHTLTYKGMSILPILEANTATQFWIGARYFEAILLLSAPLFLTRSMNRNSIFVIMGAIASTITLSISYGFFPDCFIDGKGLTTFKVVSEYLIIFLLMGAIAFLIVQRQHLDRGVIHLLVASMVLTMFAELAFTFYVNVYGFSNLVGHIFKLISYWLIFIAIVRTTLQTPFQMMARTASTYDAIPDAITVVDSDGIVRQANNPAILLGGDDLIGAHIHAIFHSSEVNQENCSICKNIALKKPLSEVDGFVTKTQRWFDYTLSPIFLGSQDAGMVHVMRDITSHKLAKEEIALHRENLELLVKERTHKLESANKELESFSYSVSHDLRAPLRAISGFSTILLEESSNKLDAEEKDYLNRIVGGANNMSVLINSLLQLSRITRKNMHNDMVNLSEIATDSLNRLTKNSPTRKIKIAINNNLVANGDASLLQIMLFNLLDNAWKYTSKTKDSYIEFGATLINNQRTFFIADNGVGFDMKHSNKLFNAFQRLHKAEEFPGTGIGLATVQRIIHRHGGNIRVESTINKGTTFYFTLPNSN